MITRQNRLSMVGRLFVALTFVLVPATAARASSFSAAYDFNGVNLRAKFLPYNGTSVDNLVFDQITNVGPNRSTLPDAWTNEWPTESRPDLISFRYTEFTIVPDEGFAVSLQNLLFDVVGVGQGNPGRAEWRSSLDSFASPITTYSSLNPAISQSGGVLSLPSSYPTDVSNPAPLRGNVLDLSDPRYQSVTKPLTLRLYMYGADVERNQAGLFEELRISGEVANPSKPPVGLINAPTLDQYNAVSLRAIPFPEASGVAYDRDQDALFMIGDEGDIAAFNRRGDLVRDDYGRVLSEDLEGIASLGNGLFVVAEERDQNVFLAGPVDIVNDPQNPNIPVSSPALSIAGRGGNSGLEGVGYDPLTGDIWGVKEKDDITVYQATNVDLVAGTGDIVIPFDASTFGVNDLSDIYLLSNSLAFVGTNREQNILLLSQESNLLLEVTRTGTLMNSMDLSFLGLEDGFEGVTMDDDGNLYLVAEPEDLGSVMYTLRAEVPEPGTVTLLGVSCIGLIMRRRSRV